MEERKYTTSLAKIGKGEAWGSRSEETGSEMLKVIFFIRRLFPAVNTSTPICLYTWDWSSSHSWPIMTVSHLIYYHPQRVRARIMHLSHFLVPDPGCQLRCQLHFKDINLYNERYSNSYYNSKMMGWMVIILWLRKKWCKWTRLCSLVLERICQSQGTVVSMWWLCITGITGPAMTLQIFWV